MKHWINKLGTAISLIVFVFTSGFGFTRQFHTSEFDLIGTVDAFLFGAWDNIGTECTVGPDGTGAQVCKDNQTCPKKKTSKAGFDPKKTYSHKCERTVWMTGKPPNQVSHQACECQPY